MSATPKAHDVDAIFGQTRYYIDFYQREYKWGRSHVKSLLDDIFYRFDAEYKSDIDITLEAIDQYGWYYLNTYVTNTYQGKKYIVDGQQRFTTITLILIKLLHLAISEGLDKRAEWIKSKIYGVGAEGRAFWMGTSDERRDVLDNLYENDDKKIQTTGLSKKSITVRNLISNYRYISEKFSSSFKDTHRIDCFILFFLKRIHLVEIDITDAKDVPMVFEVINDRGERLKPYEVLKGELLGQIDKSEIESYNEIWTKRIEKLQRFGELEIDTFFRTFFRAKYVDSRSEYRDFDGEYHKTIFSPKWCDRIALKRNPKGVKDFIKNDFSFYADLYISIQHESRIDNTPLFFNALNKQDRQSLLILSAINSNEKEPLKKAYTVARNLDRLFVILQLSGCYDSNRFTETIIHLNKEVRGGDSIAIEKAFNDRLAKDVFSAKLVQIDSEKLSWALFKDAGYSLGSKFLRYFFARVDHFISKETGIPTSSYYDFVQNTGYKNGHHIEHILANNAESLTAFNDDEDTFLVERNRLGGMAAIKGSVNISSSNEPYADKVKTYSHQALWARSLTESFYHKNPNFNDACKRLKLPFKSYSSFGSNELDERHRLLYSLTRLIWSTNVLEDDQELKKSEPF